MQDISCVGKCSLTVALPVMSALGVETCVIPTALLSTHTMFRDFTFLDLTDEIDKITSHFKAMGFAFDGVYTGYLGSLRQIDIAKKLLADFSKGKLKVVDPCMADNGKFYTGFDQAYAKEMASLCKDADIIVPNLSEACFLLDIPYLTAYTKQDIENILVKLTDLGCQTAVITGVSFEENTLGAYAYDAMTKTFTSYFSTEEPTHFHGTGDLWASTFTACLLQNKSLKQALMIACEFVRISVAKTIEEENHNEYGVNFEQAIPDLLSLYRNC